MHLQTKRARAIYRAAAKRLEQARQDLATAQREFDEAEAEARTAKSEFSTHLELDGSSFDQWQENRDAFGAILSALPQ